MSGGSFNYLYGATLTDREGDLRLMASELRSLGFHDIARETESFIAEPNEALRKVWHAVEWWRSNDWSKGQAADVAVAYDRLHPFQNQYDRDGIECRCGRFISHVELAREA